MEEQARTPETGRKKWIIAMAVLALILAAGAVLLFGVNRFYLDIVLDGGEEIVLEYGSEYRQPGAALLLKGTRFLTEGVEPEGAVLTVEGTVDPELGEYRVCYSGRYRWLSCSKDLVVRIVDTTPPELKLVADPYLEWVDGKPYKEEGFSATDLHDGDLTQAVQRQELYGRVIYTVSDASGNTSTAEREIPLYDPLAPTILLEGEKTIHLELGRPYVEPGYMAVDNVEGDLTQQVLVEGDVNWFKTGIYPITYKVRDSQGNWGFQVRTVEVAKAPRPEVVTPKGKVIYLTFNDGPGPHTDALLDVLGMYGVKATFFVTDSGYDDVMKRIVEEGHSIGIHTVDPDDDTIYRDRQSYFDDLYAMRDIIYRNTGVKTTLLRFPGGSSKLSAHGLMTVLTRAVQDAGFQYFDWNVDSNDSGGAASAAQVLQNVISGVQGNRVSVVVQRDIHDYSVEAVEQIILWGLGNGYSFLPLQSDSPGCHYPIYN